jgi:hypothetical protein
VFDLGDVHCAVHKHSEAQTRSGAEFEHAQPTLDPVAKRHQADATELRQRTRQSSDLVA